MLDYTWVEIRKPASLLLDNLPNYDLTRKSVFKVDDFNTTILPKIVNGEYLMLGQVVLIKSLNDDVSFGQLPAIVTKIRTLVSNIEYTLFPIIGDFNGVFINEIYPELVMSSKDTIDDITVSDSDILPGVMSSIIDTGLGADNVYDMLYAKIGISRLCVLDTEDSDNIVFNTML